MGFNLACKVLTTMQVKITSNVLFTLKFTFMNKNMMFILAV